MNLQQVLAAKFEPVAHVLNARDCMLYALGIGIGERAEDASQLRFCYEEGLAVFPSMVNVIGYPGSWVRRPELGIDWVKVLHGEQVFSIDGPLQPDATYEASFRIKDVVDKGPGKGAFLFFEKLLRDKESGKVVSSVTSTYALRGDGGCGGTTETAPVPHALPDRAPDGEVALATLPQAALIYRLSGDYNPIHGDPAMARKAGFERPILHGLCTLGVATRALLGALGNDDPAALRSVRLRFSAPVYPGETIVTQYWRDGASASFRALSAERGVVVLNNGHAEFNT